MLQVERPPAGSLKSDLESGVAATGGYTVVAVSGLGDEAAAAFATADPSKSITGGLAVLEARKGDVVLALSVPYGAIAEGSAEFDQAKSLLATALTRLP